MPSFIIRSARPDVRLQQLNFGTVLAIAWRAVRRQFVRRRQREALRAIADDQHLLRDLGLTRQQALDEADKFLWQ
jgi:uncharacterized protein YjiS (DUF1127 family)